MYKVLNMITRKYKYKITELLPKNKQLSNKRDNFMYNNTVLKFKRYKRDFCQQSIHILIYCESYLIFWRALQPMSNYFSGIHANCSR